MNQPAIPLMELLANPLGCQKSTTKWLVISNQKKIAKWLVISQPAGKSLVMRGSLHFGLLATLLHRSSPLLTHSRSRVSAD